MTVFLLKIIAVISMFIDHYAVSMRLIMSRDTYTLCRCIGRIAFPIFAFLLVEGFRHTRSRKNYLIRLLIFSLISELPFDIVLERGLTDMTPGPFVWSHQNVFFTLAIGLALLMALDHSYDNNLPGWDRGLYCLLAFCIAELMQTDYSAFGICTILLFYYRQTGRLPGREPATLFLCFASLLLAAVGSSIQGWCVLAWFPLSLYNGDKGPSLKYFFYAFYPVHLVIIYMIYQVRIYR